MEAARISKILQAIRKNFVCPTTNKETYCTSYLRAMHCVGLRVGKSAGMDWYHSFQWISILYLYQYLHQTNYNTFKVLIGRWGWKVSPPFEKRVEVGNFSFLYRFLFYDTSLEIYTYQKQNDTYKRSLRLQNPLCYNILGENGGLSNLTNFQGCRRNFHHFSDAIPVRRFVT